MKKILLSTLLFLGTFLSTQAIGFDWYGLSNTSGSYKVTDLVYDNHYIYGVGEFDDISIIVGGNTLTNSSTNGTTDIFVFKADTLGNVIWSSKFGGIGIESSNNMYVDNAGNALITGSYESSGIFGTNTIISNGGKDIFVLKLNATGGVQWVTSIGGSADDIGNDVCSDHNNDVYFVSTLKSAVTFPNVTTNNSATSYPGMGKLDNSGNKVWLKFTNAQAGPNIENDFGASIKYNAVDSSIHALTTIRSHDWRMYDPNNFPGYSYFASPGRAVTFEFNIDSTLIDIRGYSYTSLTGAFSRDAVICDSSIYTASDVSLNIGGYANSYIEHRINGAWSSATYQFTDPIGYPNGPGTISIPKLSCTNGELYAIQQYTDVNSTCPRDLYDVIHKSDLSSAFDSLDIPSFFNLPIYGLTSNNNTVYISGEGYVGKVCQTNSCAVNPINPPVPLTRLGSLPDQIKCDPQTIWIGANECYYVEGGTKPYSYSWSPTIGLSSPNSLSTTCNVATTTTYILTITDSLNNSIFDTITVTVNPSSITNVVVTTSADSVCHGDSVSISVSFNGGLNYPTWLRQGPGSSNPSYLFISTPSISISTANLGYGLYTFIYRGTDTLSNCIKDIPVHIYIRNNSSLTISPSTTTICEGSPITLSASGNNSYSQFFTYNYNTNSYDSIGQNNTPIYPTHTNSAYPNTPINIAVIGYDSLGCPGMNSSNIIVTRNKVDTVISTSHPNNPICTSDSVDLVGYPQIEYCDDFSSYPSSAGEYISAIFINNNSFYQNTSGSSAAVYNVYPALSTNLSANSTYVLGVTRSGGCTNCTDYIRKAWIDYNHDGDFDDSLENIMFDGSSIITNTAIFTVPSFAINGPTRMRIAYHKSIFNAGISGCGLEYLSTFYLHDVEDYDFTIINGIPDSNYIWSPSVNLTNIYGYKTTVTNNTTPTTYTLTYLGDTCNIGKSIRISSPPSIAISSSVTPAVLCQGDSLVLHNSVANSNYTNSWTGGISDSLPFSPNGSQTYVLITTDSSGCSATDSINIIINNLPIVSANNLSNSNPLNVCINDSALLWGSGALTYSWTGGIMDSIPFVPNNTQTYIVTGTDSNNCIATDSISVVLNPLPLVTANSIPNQNPVQICIGDSITLFGAGANSYTWTGNVIDGTAFAVLANQTYYLTGIDSNNCTASDSIQVIANPIPTPILSFNGTSLNCTGVSNLSSYNWLLNGSAFGGNTATQTITQNGTYVVEVIDSNGCSGFDTLEVFNLSAANIANSQNISIYPNPTTGVFTVSSYKEFVGKLEVFNLVGKKVLSADLNSKEQDFDISNFASGTYMVRIISNGQWFVSKLILE